jgi:hypothetical protein
MVDKPYFFERYHCPPCILNLSLSDARGSLTYFAILKSGVITIATVSIPAVSEVNKKSSCEFW